MPVAAELVEIRLAHSSSWVVGDRPRHHQGSGDKVTPNPQTLNPTPRHHPGSRSRRSCSLTPAPSHASQQTPDPRPTPSPPHPGLLAPVRSLNDSRSSLSWGGKACLCGSASCLRLPRLQVPVYLLSSNETGCLLKRRHICLWRIESTGPGVNTCANSSTNRGRSCGPEARLLSCGASASHARKCSQTRSATAAWPIVPRQRRQKMTDASAARPGIDEQSLDL